MNEEYLWDRSGEDEEIRKLENALAEFRYRPAEAPKVPFKFQAVEPNLFGKWKIFSLRFALAFSAVAVAFAGAWIVLQKKIPAEGIETVFVGVPMDQEPFFAEKGTDIDPPPQPVEPVPDTAVKVRPTRESRTASRNLNKTAKKLLIQRTKPFVLTAEEKYAYNEVRRALSISSEKLRIVKDTINGTVESGRRNGR